MGAALRKAVIVSVAGLLVIALAVVTSCASAVSGMDDAIDQVRSLPVPPATADVRPDLEDMTDGDSLDIAIVDVRFDAIRHRLDDVRFLLVPGYLTDFLEVLQALGIIDQFGDQIAALEAVGFDVEVGDLKTEATVAQSAEVIAAAVRSDARPICIMSGSKGSIDALEFLIRADAETRARIACWVALQAPLAGSPVADGVASQGLLRLVIGSRARGLRG